MSRRASLPPWYCSDQEQSTSKQLAASRAHRAVTQQDDASPSVLRPTSSGPHLTTHTMGTSRLSASQPLDGCAISLRNCLMRSCRCQTSHRPIYYCNYGTQNSAGARFCMSRGTTFATGPLTRSLQSSEASRNTDLLMSTLRRWHALRKRSLSKRWHSS